MSDLNNKYKNIINEIEEKIKNPEELEFVKGKFTELWTIISVNYWIYLIDIYH